jgi:hypothetical protein
MVVLDHARTEGDGWRFGGAGDRHSPASLLTFRSPDGAQYRSGGDPTNLYSLHRPAMAQRPVVGRRAVTLDRCAATARSAGWRDHDLPTTHDGAMLSDQLC